MAKKNIQSSRADEKRYGWLEDALNNHENLCSSAESIVRSLLDNENIEYLAVTGRVKTYDSAIEKIKRKSYRDPSNQLTDLTGIRIILYFESDVKRASEIIERSFNVDKDNSLDRNKLLDIDKIGYRSVHYVCDLGPERLKLPEFRDIGSLKFEFQIRTILQHAWAELAHDRNYKFSGKLPTELERSLYLYAGMLEIADKGFDDLSKKIDEYKKEVENKSARGDLDIEVDSLSLFEFVDNWAKHNNIEEYLEDFSVDSSVLVKELNDYDIKSLSDLQKIIPENYAEIMSNISRSNSVKNTTFGVVRDWMIINDYQKFFDQVDFNWVIDEEGMLVMSEFFDQNQLEEIVEMFKAHDAYDAYDDDFLVEQFLRE